ncbi:hypothetical protein HDU89_006123 [Geranomyces variabilis]|nr:hypothetical protein HDU89_006123 [Geranomyces variabilis]
MHEDSQPLISSATARDDFDLGNAQDPLARRWAVVQSTKAKLHTALAFHAAQALTALTFAVFVGTNAIYTYKRSEWPGTPPIPSERLCILRPNSYPFQNGPMSSCAWPIAQACFSILVAALLAAWDYRRLKLAQHQSSSAASLFASSSPSARSRDARPLLVTGLVCGLMAILTLSMAVSIQQSVGRTCTYLFTRHELIRKCADLWSEAYPGHSLGALDFGMLAGYVAAAVWVVSGFVQYREYRRATKGSL